MNGSWHRYRPGERWRRPPARARLVLEVEARSRSASTRRSSSCSRRAPRRSTRRCRGSGRTCSQPDFDARRGASPAARSRARATLTIGAALLDQRALAGIGNIWRNETLFAERVDPFARVADARRRDARSADLDGARGCSRRERRRSRPGRAPTRRLPTAGRPCPRCGTLDPRRRRSAARLPRTTYWCPTLPGRTGMSDIDGRLRRQRPTAGAARSTVARRPRARRATT